MINTKIEFQCSNMQFLRISLDNHKNITKELKKKFTKHVLFIKKYKKKIPIIDNKENYLIECDRLNAYERILLLE